MVKEKSETLQSSTKEKAKPHNPLSANGSAIAEPSEEIGSKVRALSTFRVAKNF